MRQAGIHVLFADLVLACGDQPSLEIRGLRSHLALDAASTFGSRFWLDSGRMEWGVGLVTPERGRRCRNRRWDNGKSGTTKQLDIQVISLESTLANAYACFDHKTRVCQSREHCAQDVYCEKG
jgi:hypothetical protein